MVRRIATGLVFCWLALAASGAFAAEISVLGGLTREATLVRGAKIEGRILLRNNTPNPQEVKLYQTDYLAYSDGRSLYGEPGSAPRSNCSWITFDPRELEIPGQGMASVYYTVQVPQDEKLVGTYWSMLMVEPLSQQLDALAAEQGKPAVGINTVVRYGMQFVTHIGETGKRDSKFLAKRLIANDDQIALQLDVENTGERWLRPSVWAELYDEVGVSIGRFGGERLRIFPGCSTRFKIDLTELPAGKYSALVVADNGDDYVFGAQCKLRIE